MSRLVVLVTSPRLPAGLLTSAAWQTLASADVVAGPSAQLPLVQALVAQGYDVEVVAEPSVPRLLDKADSGTVVWVADDHERWAQQLATEVVRRSELSDTARPPDVEILVGSFDPVGARVLDLVEVMDRLRAECPWDQQQTHESLVRYLVEETYETIEAIESGDRAHLREELGDLLLQVVFHARIASEDADEPFAIDDVAGDAVEKLIRRHPHVFADVQVSGAAEVEANWESIKVAEKVRSSAMDGIPLGMPALSLASKIVSRTLRGGGVSVPTPDDTAYTEASLGEVLFALAAAAAAAGLDPEQALRRRVVAEIAQVRLDEQRALPGTRDEPG